MITAPVPATLVPAYAVPIALAAWALYLGWDAIRRHASEGWAIVAYPALVALVEVLAYRGTVLGVWTAGATTQTDAGETVKVAGVVADLGPGPAGLPPADAVARNTEELFGRSEAAARTGARVVVWNEAATVVDRSEETVFLERGARLARDRGVDLVLAYLVPLSSHPLRFENKYVWLSQDGEPVETYFKHHPVPGEGSVRGTDPLRVLERPYGLVAGAICYDYDFPAMALEHARLGAGLVVVPSSDWKGIDPYHTHMARIRAIEGGFSLLRPVRWATSGAFDAYGRPRAMLSHFESNDRILLAALPVERVPTLYARLGDAPAAVYVLIPPHGWPRRRQTDTWRARPSAASAHRLRGGARRFAGGWV